MVCDIKGVWGSLFLWKIPIPVAIVMGNRLILGTGLPRGESPSGFRVEFMEHHRDEISRTGCWKQTRTVILSSFHPVKGSGISGHGPRACEGQRLG
jgi:hypothetical protein